MSLVRSSLVLVFIAVARSMQAQSTPVSDPPANAYGHSRPSPSVRAIRSTGRIRLDGRFDEAEWAAAPVASGFRQVDPNEGALATQRTEVRFLYDDDALYVAARLFDTEGARGVRAQLARRDNAYDADWFELAFDAYHDHVRRVFMSVTPSGAKNDETAVGSACCDAGWDPVWDVATQIDNEGWTAEFRIPFSQLRMPVDSIQNWGLQLKRVVSRINETSLWSFWRRNEPGGAPYYGHLEDLRIGAQPRHAELLPYAVARAKALAPITGDPFHAATRRDARVGADFKVLLTPNLTLTGTVNPDFGQVEVDPAVVNLSAFETFFPEKRPFFVEGVGTFRFGRTICAFCSNFQSIESFYSRRVGRAPTAVALARAAGPFTDIPEASTILGAAKVTGRTRGGVSVGILNAVTRREDAAVQRTDGSRTSVTVEPMSNYLVARATADRRGGNLVTGVFASSVVRSLPTELRPLFNAHSEMFGVDVESYWRNRRYSLLGSLMFSNIAGDPAAMIERQRTSARYFQRPDDRRPVDSLAKSLQGAGAYVRVAKDAGNWTWETSVNTRTPGYEVNDIAFQSRADFIGLIGNVSRLFNQPTRWYRRIGVTVGGQLQRNYQGLTVPGQQVHLAVSLLTPAFWSLNGFTYVRPSVLDDRLLRGGPSVRVPRSSAFNVGLSTDSRRRFSASTSVIHAQSGLGDRTTSAGLSFNGRPRSNLTFSAGPFAQLQRSKLQYVTSTADPTAIGFAGRRYVLADLRQSTVSVEMRADVTITPTLSFEFFAQPFIAAGAYSGFKEFDAPRSGTLRTYGRDVGTIAPTSSPSAGYTIDPDAGGPAASFFLADPDFTQRSLRGNAVIRWEYRPGSTLYFAWTQSRTQSVADGTLDLARDADALFSVRPDNIFMVKASWWFAR